MEGRGWVLVTQILEGPFAAVSEPFFVTAGSFSAFLRSTLIPQDLHTFAPLHSKVCRFSHNFTKFRDIFRTIAEYRRKFTKIGNYCNLIIFTEESRLLPVLREITAHCRKSVYFFSNRFSRRIFGLDLLVIRTSNFREILRGKLE